MFKNLTNFNNIIVSGPQRSGTRFMAKTIAKELDKLYIDERDVAKHDFRLLEYYLSRGNVVI